MSDMELVMLGVPDPTIDGGARGPRRPMRLAICGGVGSGASMPSCQLDEDTDTPTVRVVLVGLN